MSRRHLHAVIWSTFTGQPLKMGDLVLTEERISFTYGEEYLDAGAPGFCLLGDATLWGRETMEYSVSERVPVFPRLLSLMPGRGPRNLQRKHYLDILRARDGAEPPPTMETEWRLLTLAGHGGIGHVDLFADDLSAATWYRHATEGHPTTTPLDERSQIWRMLKREVADENLEFDPRLVEQALGPTPSVGGMIPKLLLATDRDDDALPLHPPGLAGKRELVVKLEPPEYQGVLDLEALCLDLHREAGFTVPRYRRANRGGLELLAVERFDRTDAGLPIPMESLFSVIATGDHGFRETGDLLLEELGDIIRRLRDVTTLPADTEEQLYHRILLALLTGNGDLHLDNLALLGARHDCALTPIYDPAPMRAWPRHDLVSAIPFDPAAFPSRWSYFIQLGKRFGLSNARTRWIIDQSLAATTDYTERVASLSRVPQARREQLIGVVERERKGLEAALRQPS